MWKNTWIRHSIVLTTALAFVAMDLWTKSLASSAFTLGQPKPIIPGFFSLTLVHNTGAAFGMGKGMSSSFFIIVSILAMGIIGFLYAKVKESEKLALISLVFIFSGAVGNFIDRLRFDYVVDFLLVYVRIGGKEYDWPAFNVADAYITIGAILYGIEVLFLAKKREEAASSN